MDGVGDDRHSWAFDGKRQKKWNGTDADYGTTLTSWAVGDVVGCSLEVSDEVPVTRVESGQMKKASKKGKTAKSAVVSSTDPQRFVKMQFSVNGNSLGEAFSFAIAGADGGGDKFEIVADANVAIQGLFHPALSLESGEAVLLNIGQRPFQFPPLAVEDTKEGGGSSAIAVVESSGYRPVIDALPVDIRAGIPRESVDSFVASTSASSKSSTVDNLIKTVNPDIPVAIASKVSETSRIDSSTTSRETFPVIDLESDALYPNIAALEKHGLQHLKAELERRNLKAGGTLTERAESFYCRVKS